MQISCAHHNNITITSVYYTVYYIISSFVGFICKNFIPHNNNSNENLLLYLKYLKSSVKVALQYYFSQIFKLNPIQMLMRLQRTIKYSTLPIKNMATVLVL